jgi:hypothetical protein
MSNREDRLRSLLDKVRAKRPDERATRAADALDRIRAASGTTSATTARSSSSSPVQPSPASQRVGQPTPFPSSFAVDLPSSPLPEPPTSPTINSPTRYSSQPPRVERPLSVEPRARSIRPSSGASAVTSPSRQPESIRPQSVAPTGQPVVYSTEQPEFPRPKTFGELLELTLSLRPR